MHEWAAAGPIFMLQCSNCMASMASRGSNITQLVADRIAPSISRLGSTATTRSSIHTLRLLGMLSSLCTATFAML